MSETAEERRKRLRALREEADVARKPETQKEPDLKFRNYLPRDEELLEGQIKAVQAPEMEVPAAEPIDNDDDDENVVAGVMPKKANWDLRRDVEKKMERLEKRTQRAMIELMREEEERRMNEAEEAAQAQ